MHWKRTLTMVGCHVGGEANDVVTGGLGDIQGSTVFEKRLYFERHYDQLRRCLLLEPRGAPARCVNFVVPACDPRAQLGYIIAESTEYPSMSGSNTICTATVLLETGILPMTEPVTEISLESPAGLIPLRCECSDGKVTSVRFTNQPCFVQYLDATVEVPGHGSVSVDVAWGGMHYAIVNAQSLGFSLIPDEARDICVLGQLITEAAAEQLSAVHPQEPRYPGISLTEFAGPLRRESGVLVSRNTVVVQPGRLDRSPCGTGSCARMAVLRERNLLAVGEPFVHESIIGSRFNCRIEETTSVGRYPAIIPSVAGQAWITGITQVGIDPTDPFAEGYTLPDMWLRPV
jgi:proline racemase